MDVRLDRYDRSILCCHIFSNEDLSLLVGSRWGGGGSTTVILDSVDGEWATYSWFEDGVKKSHEKLGFAFQCRYCLLME